MGVRAREGDFIETTEGLIFDVKGLSHPADRIIAFLRYYPKTDGNRFRDGIHYGKIYSLSERYDFLEKNYPQYLFYDKLSDETLQGIPIKNIKKIYCPEEFIKKFVRRNQIKGREADSLVLKKGLNMLNLIHTQSGVGYDKMGISGSVLVNLETDESDIDLIIYGSKNACKVYDSLSKMHHDQLEVIHPYSETEIAKLYKFRGKESNLNLQEFAKIERRKKLQGIFDGTEYYIRCIKDRDEILHNYEEIQYKCVGKGTLSGVITDDTEAILTPCKYLIDVSRMEGVNFSGKIQEIASFRGRFCEQAKKGEQIKASGKIELVKSPEDEFYRLLIGSYSEDFFRVLNL
jgi:predicted nucleotidyltransferase